ncbi:tRNA-uridine aminocarboxypropyltransferase [Aliiglaciecola litoralis]|uniref:tRNA-uridine aminocarboxypropyltransferase n=1 Tax=Aliiglaciecola litoralis TaxID=582857 RepID=A0ABP3WQL0_9ALTE
MCHAISPLTIPVKLVVLQHPLETKHAKNTARLIKLCVPDCELMVGESAEDFNVLQETIKQQNINAGVLYPHQHSMALESAKQRADFTPPDTLILIDATWRKAHKMWQLNPWLHSLPSWHFEQLPKADYRVRKSQLAHSLSTIEATSHALQHLFNVDTQPLITVFNAMQKNIEQFIPKC